MRGRLCKNRLAKPRWEPRRGRGVPAAVPTLLAQQGRRHPTRRRGGEDERAGSHEGEPPTRERMPGVTRPLSHTLRTRVAEGSHVLRPCAEALRGAHVPRPRLRGTVGTLQPRGLPRRAVLFKATGSALFRPFPHFHFFPSSLLSPEEPHVRAEHRLLPSQPITAWLPPYWPSPRVP